MAVPHKGEHLDPDLAAHFTVIKHRGLCVFGTPIDVMFADVPRECYVDSIVKDSEDSFKNIQERTSDEKCVVPNYAVLNFCRVIAFLDQGVITSKMEGGAWALSHLPKQYHAVIRAAMKEYGQPGSSQRVEGHEVKQFATFSQSTIQQRLSKEPPSPHFIGHPTKTIPSPERNLTQ